jgi:RNA polymerase sigma factor (sigma-70 family)
MSLFLDRRELLARFRAGERRALEETYRFYAPVVANFLSRGFAFNSGDQTLRFAGYRQAFDLDNALAETFVRAFSEQARLRYDGINPYKNYLLTIARNLVIDELRGREIAMNPEPLETIAEEDEPTAEEDLLAKELAQLCERFIGNLAERDRIFFKARFEEARTQVDAGKSAGLSHMQARTLEQRLRKRFLAFLKSSGYLEGYQR